ASDHQEKSPRPAACRTFDAIKIESELGCVFCHGRSELAVGLEVDDGPAGEIIQVLTKRQICYTLDQQSVFPPKDDRCFTAKVSCRFGCRGQAEQWMVKGCNNRRRRPRNFFFGRTYHAAAHGGSGGDRFGGRIEIDSGEQQMDQRTETSSLRPRLVAAM